ncbi:hypothetical protein RvY_16675 [Ramazzottius varieornatus]|uniref:Uncharacterized protein n=1 Tax=Ramazzottius varieornatus TaxID=947166 RepID=A0A1D1VZD2_RAMVA|nr:hypothetical protein RvY_16675 [Ramazzottius varieornatus]
MSPHTRTELLETLSALCFAVMQPENMYKSLVLFDRTMHLQSIFDNTDGKLYIAANVPEVMDCDVLRYHFEKTSCRLRLSRRKKDPAVTGYRVTEPLHPTEMQNLRIMGTSCDRADQRDPEEACWRFASTD